MRLGYYLFFSSNNFNTLAYDISYAVSQSVTGPFTKVQAPNGPFLTRYDSAIAMEICFDAQRSLAVLKALLDLVELQSSTCWINLSTWHSTQTLTVRTLQVVAPCGQSPIFALETVLRRPAKKSDLCTGRMCVNDIVRLFIWRRFL
jgi:hypothetical protein